MILLKNRDSFSIRIANPPEVKKLGIANRFAVRESKNLTSLAVALFQTSPSGTRFQFTATEWEQALAVKEILHPAFEATVELSGEAYVSGSKVIPITKSLLQWYGEAGRKHGNRESFKGKLIDVLNKSLYKYLALSESVDVLAVSTLCDPRYKREGFKSSEACSWATGKVKEAMKQLSGEKATDRPTTPAPGTSSSRPSSSLWSTFDKEISEKSGTVDEDENPCRNELVKYMRRPHLPRSSNPLQWWQNTGKEQYPLLSQVAMKALIVPGTSVPSERVFSSASSVITKKRTRLSDSSAANLIFLHENMAKKARK